MLKFSHPVRLDDVAKRIYFQDRDTAARQEAELSMRDEDRDEQPEAAVLRATPRAPLPSGRTWDLIVEDVREQTSGNGLPYLRRVPLGITTPLGLKWLAAFNLPLEKPLVRARFDDYLDPATVTRDTVSIDPSVPNLKVRADDEDLVLEGDFDLAKHYEVTVKPGVKGRRGYGLAAASRWGATFRPKASAIFFPDARISERAALGLRFSFLQVHTGALRWRLAAVPLEKLAAVGKRTREFEQAKPNPFGGPPETNDLGIEIPQPTVLLVDAFGLETRAEGTFPASAGEAETLRDIRWTPPDGKGVPSGAYLLEVDGPAWDGKGSVGHRSLVFFSESIITEKRTPDTVLARVAGMADGLPRPGLTVRAVSSSNYEVARATTDADGVARFASASLTPPANQKGGESAVTFIADAPEGPSIATIDGESFEDVYFPDPPAHPPTGERTRAIVITDRSLYRPGHTVRIKGIVRTTRADKSEHGKLHIPAGQSVHWSISKSSEGESVIQGDTEVDEDGGWEAKWDIPAGAKLGDYHLTSALKRESKPADDGSDDDNGSSNGSAELHVQDYKVPLFEVAATSDPVAPPESKSSTCKVHGGYFSGQPVAGARVSWRVHWERSDQNSVPQGGAKPDDEDRYSDNEPMLTEYDQFSERAVTSPPELSMAESKGEAKTDGKGDAEIRVDLPPNLPGARYTARWEIAVTSADGQSVASSASPTQILMRQPVLLGVGSMDKVTEGQPLAPKTVRVLLGAFDALDKPTRARDAKVELFRVGTKTVREDVAPFVVRYRNTPLYKSVKTATVAQVGPESFVDMGIGDAGRYAAVVSAPGLNPVSTEIFVAGPGEDEVPVETPTTLQVLHPEKKEYTPGEKGGADHPLTRFRRGVGEHRNRPGVEHGARPAAGQHDAHRISGEARVRSGRHGGGLPRAARRHRPIARRALRLGQAARAADPDRLLEVKPTRWSLPARAPRRGGARVGARGQRGPGRRRGGRDGLGRGRRRSWPWENGKPRTSTAGFYPGSAAPGENLRRPARIPPGHLAPEPVPKGVRGRRRRRGVRQQGSCARISSRSRTGRTGLKTDADGKRAKSSPCNAPDNLTRYRLTRRGADPGRAVR